MTGANGFGKFGSTDGNDIPVREAFEWYQSVEGEGMALWYKNTGPWWDQTQLKKNDGISLEEQKVDPNSLWHFYKTFIELRKANSALKKGRLQFLDDKNKKVLSFLRWDDEQAILVLMNLNDKEELIRFDLAKFPIAMNMSQISALITTPARKPLEIDQGKVRAKLVNFEVQVWRIR
jgi:glycosidase